MTRWQAEAKEGQVGVVAMGQIACQRVTQAAQADHFARFQVNQAPDPLSVSITVVHRGFGGQADDGVPRFDSIASPQGDDAK